MANNRMYIFNKRTKQKIFVAKYYPSTGWYVDSDDLVNKLNGEFNLASFGQENWPNAGKEFSSPSRVKAVEGAMGGNDWCIKYESADDPQDELPGN